VCMHVCACAYVWYVFACVYVCARTRTCMREIEQGTRMRVSHMCGTLWYGSYVLYVSHMCHAVCCSVLQCVAACCCMLCVMHFCHMFYMYHICVICFICITSQYHMFVIWVAVRDTLWYESYMSHVCVTLYDMCVTHVCGTRWYVSYVLYVSYVWPLCHAHVRLIYESYKEKTFYASSPPSNGDLCMRVSRTIVARTCVTHIWVLWCDTP